MVMCGLGRRITSFLRARYTARMGPLQRIRIDDETVHPNRD